MIFVKDENNKVYLKGTDVELSMAALSGIAQQLSEVIEGNLDNLKPVNQKNARVLKSFASEGGAKNWIEVQKKLGKGEKVEGAVIVKSFDSYGDVAYADPMPSMSPPVHVVIEESMAPVAEVVSVKDADEMFRMMYKKGLMDVNGGMVVLSDKFYTLLSTFTEKMLTDTLKSTEMDERGRSYKEIGEEILKASKGGGTSVTPDGVGDANRQDPGKNGDPAPGMPLSEEEASNHKGNTRQESLAADGTGDTKRQDPGSSGDPAPGLLISQEDADNKNATPEAITDAEAKSKQTNVEASPQRELAVFKSLIDARNFTNMNKEYDYRTMTHSEKLAHGKKYSYIAEPKAPKDESLGAYGGRKNK